MAIKQWLCPACRFPVALDHFETTECGNVVHPDYAARVRLNYEARDRSHVHVTDGLSCARKVAIQAQEDIVVDPLAFNAVTTGQAWHSALDLEASYNEISISAEIEGMRIHGSIDRIRYDAPSNSWIIEDHKHVSDMAMKYMGGTAREGDRVQVSIYRALLEDELLRTDLRAGEYKISFGLIWYHASSAFFARRVEFLPLAECLSYRPWGGDYTVLELWKQVEAALPTRESAHLHWADLPLAGESMRFGNSVKTICDYCHVREMCSLAARGAPF